MKSIGSMVDEQFQRWDGLRRASQPPPVTASGVLARRVVTVSRAAGSGARLVCASLAQRLGWATVDRELLDTVARLAHVSPGVVERFDERPMSDLGRFVHGLLGNRDLAGFGGAEYLEQAIRAVSARGDVIIVGRGAHLVLSDAFHVRVEASHAHRRANMIQFDGLLAEDADARIRQSDWESRRVLVEAHGRERVDGAHFDITLQMDRLGIDGAAELLGLAVRQWCRP